MRQTISESSKVGKGSKNKHKVKAGGLLGIVFKFGFGSDQLGAVFNDYFVGFCIWMSVASFQQQLSIRVIELQTSELRALRVVEKDYSVYNAFSWNASRFYLRL